MQTSLNDYDKTRAMLQEVGKGRQ